MVRTKLTRVGDLKPGDWVHVKTIRGGWSRNAYYVAASRPDHFCWEIWVLYATDYTKPAQRIAYNDADKMIPKVIK